MSTHDMNIANQGFPSFRSDLNNALAALASNSSSATAPSTTYGGQIWFDTNANRLYLRNKDNDSWVSLAYVDPTNDEWELFSAVVQAVDGAGVSLKTNSGDTGLLVNNNGSVNFKNYGFPLADGQANQVLQTNGSGTLSFGEKYDANQIVQIQQYSNINTAFEATSSTSFVASTISKSITPKFSNSLIRVRAIISMGDVLSATNIQTTMFINGTQWSGTNNYLVGYQEAGIRYASFVFEGLYQATTTNQLTFAVAYKSGNGSPVRLTHANASAGLALEEIKQ